MQGSERKALGQIQPSAGCHSVGSRRRCTFGRGTSVAIASVPRGGWGCLLGGQVTGTALGLFRSVHSAVGGAEAIEEWVRSVGVLSPGSEAGAGHLAGRPVPRDASSECGSVLVAGGSRGAIGVRCPSRPRLGDWRGVVAVRPVLKHGPRSAGGARVLGAALCKPRRPSGSLGGRDKGRVRAIGESPSGGRGASPTEPCGHAVAGFESERTCCDPKDGELCPRRMKPEETLVEVRSGSDVQIDRRTWV